MGLHTDHFADGKSGTKSDSKRQIKTQILSQTQLPALNVRVVESLACTFKCKFCIHAMTIVALPFLGTPQDQWPLGDTHI